MHVAVPKMDTTATTGSDDMSDESNDRHDERMTVPEAARLLGISEGAIRKRVERGKLHAEHTPGGRLIVYLDHDERGATTPTTDTTRDRPRPSRDPKPIEPERYIRSLEDQVQDLRRRLDLETDANRENRRIIAGLIERTPELPGASESGGETPARGPVPHGQETPSSTPSTSAEGPRRSWWRRLWE